MGQSQSFSPPDIDDYEAVFSALSAYQSRQIISTSHAIKQIRQFHPQCAQTDEELVGLIVKALSGRTIAMSFDHKA